MWTLGQPPPRASESTPLKAAQQVRLPKASSKSSGPAAAEAGQAAALLKKPPSLCSVLMQDAELSSQNAHHLIFVVTLWAVDRACCAPLTGDLEVARDRSRDWRETAWALYNPLYWLLWLASTTAKTLGRWGLRLLSCGGAELEPLGDETEREFEVRTFWVLPMSGWFAVVIIVSIIQLILYTSQGAALSTNPLVPHPIIGVLTRMALSVAFVGGNALLLTATSQRDLLLLQGVTAGFIAFAASFTLLTIASLVFYATHGIEDVEFLVGILLGLGADVIYAWQSILCLKLYEEYASRPEVRSEATRRPKRAAIVLGCAVLVCIGVVALNLSSLLTDPRGFFEIIG